MSPEQARGRPWTSAQTSGPLDACCTKWWLGSRPFAGEDITETIAADYARGTGLVEGATRDPRQPAPCSSPVPGKRSRRRLADVRDARLEIDDAQQGDAVASPRVPQSRRRERLLWLALVLRWRSWPRRRWSGASVQHRAKLRVEIPTPPTTDLLSLALSPDGDEPPLRGLLTMACRKLVAAVPLDTVVTRPLRRHRWSFVSVLVIRQPLHRLLRRRRGSCDRTITRRAASRNRIAFVRRSRPGAPGIAMSFSFSSSPTSLVFTMSSPGRWRPRADGAWRRGGPSGPGRRFPAVFPRWPSLPLFGIH